MAALAATVVGTSSRWQPITMATATAQTPRSRRTADASQVRALEAGRGLPVGVRRPTRYAARRWVGCCPLRPFALARFAGATSARTSPRAVSIWSRSCPSSSPTRTRRSPPRSRERADRAAVRRPRSPFLGVARADACVRVPALLAWRFEVRCADDGVGVNAAVVDRRLGALGELPEQGGQRGLVWTRASRRVAGTGRRQDRGRARRAARGVVVLPRGRRRPVRLSACPRRAGAGRAPRTA